MHFDYYRFKNINEVLYKRLRIIAISIIVKYNIYISDSLSQDFYKILFSQAINADKLIKM